MVGRYNGLTSLWGGVPTYVIDFKTAVKTVGATNFGKVKFLQSASSSLFHCSP